MTTFKKLISIILTSIILISLVCVNVGAYYHVGTPWKDAIQTQTTNSEKSDSEPQTDISKVKLTKKAISNDHFGIDSPLPSSKFVVKKEVSISVRRFDSSYIWGAADWVVIDIERNGKLVKRCTVGIQTKHIGITYNESFTPTKTGKYTVHVGFENGKSIEPDNVNDDNYISSYNFFVVKANTLTVKPTTKTLKAAAMMKAKKTVKPVSIKKAQGKVTVKKIKKGTSSKIYKEITVDKKTGAITFKKGNYKKGTYKIKLKVTATGNKKYMSKSKTVTVKVKVK